MKEKTLQLRDFDGKAKASAGKVQVIVIVRV